MVRIDKYPAGTPYNDEIDGDVREYNVYECHLVSDTNPDQEIDIIDKDGELTLYSYIDNFDCLTISIEELADLKELLDKANAIVQELKNK